MRTLLNEPAHAVNRAVEEFFADRKAGDLLLVHFSCHGIKDQDGELYFAASDTELGVLAATAVAAEFVNRRMTRSLSRRVVLLLDCCYAGAFERGLVARAGYRGGDRAAVRRPRPGGDHRVQCYEYAFEAGELTGTDEVPPSVFTSALVRGLETGDADRDQDGLVGLDELYDYIYDRVRAATPSQTPGKWAFGMEGELYIARRSRPVSTPAPLPPELRQAIDSPLAGVRAGAVQELAAVFRGSHAGMALAAGLALEQRRRATTAGRWPGCRRGARHGSARTPPAPRQTRRTHRGERRREHPGCQPGQQPDPARATASPAKADAIHQPLKLHRATTALWRRQADQVRAEKRCEIPVPAARPTLGDHRQCRRGHRRHRPDRRAHRNSRQACHVPPKLDVHHRRSGLVQPCGRERRRLRRQ